MANDNLTVPPATPSEAAAAHRDPGKNGDWSWWNDNGTVIIGVLSVAVVAIRLLGVARGDPETAYAILQIGGSGSVLIATLVSTLGLLAVPVSVIFGYYWYTMSGSIKSALTNPSSRSHVLAASSVSMLCIALYMAPALLLYFSIAFFLGAWVVSKVFKIDNKRIVLFIYVLVFILGMLIYELGSPTPWLPVQVISVAGQRPFSGYVLTQADGQTSILTSNPEGIITVPSQKVLSAEECTPYFYLWDQATLFSLYERSRHKLLTYPPCPLTRYP